MRNMAEGRGTGMAVDYAAAPKRQAKKNGGKIPPFQLA
jgi:uncharacterized protein YoaH (UPF0181 family)